MRVEEIDVYGISIPFAVEFSHSLRRREFVNNNIVAVLSDNGEVKGYGEAAPRSYVTDETISSVERKIRDFSQLDIFPHEFDSISKVWDFVDRLPANGNINSAVCALELAILDAFARKQEKAIIEYFPSDHIIDVIEYGAAIPLGSTKEIIKICNVIKKLKISKLKLKIGRDYEQSKNAMKALKSVFGKDYELKVDVNGAWDCECGFKYLNLLKEYNVNIIEQPLMPNDPEIGEFAKAAKKEGIILMADESACSLEDVRGIAEDGHYEMINVRLSKCGGFRRSLQLIDFLREKGISFQIGCQLGETGLLSAAGRILSILCGDAKYYDGSYDKFLLRENVTTENVSFGKQGKAGPLIGPGLGVVVDMHSLEKLSIFKSKIEMGSPK